MVLVCTYVPDGVDDVGAPVWVIDIIRQKHVMTVYAVPCNLLQCTHRLRSLKLDIFTSSHAAGLEFWWFESFAME